MKIRIYYHDTDCGGIVYYGNYLKFLEEARTEFFEKLGMNVAGMAEEDVLFVVARQEIDYKSPARYGDELDVTAFPVDISRASLTFGYSVRGRGGAELVKAKTVMVCVGPDIKTKPIPSQIRERFLKEMADKG